MRLAPIHLTAETIEGGGRVEANEGAIVGRRLF